MLDCAQTVSEHNAKLMHEKLVINEANIEWTTFPDHFNTNQASTWNNEFLDTNSTMS